MKRTALKNIVSEAIKPATAPVAAVLGGAAGPSKDFAPNHSPKRAPCRQGLKSSQVFLPPDVHAELKILCVRDGISFEAYIKDLINKDLELRGMDVRIPMD